MIQYSTHPRARIAHVHLRVANEPFDSRDLLTDEDALAGAEVLP
jgi:hypothetical protein